MGRCPMSYGQGRHAKGHNVKEVRRIRRERRRANKRRNG